jgi:quercetin dioxygenase-like cupin family protein
MPAGVSVIDLWDVKRKMTGRLRISSMTNRTLKKWQERTHTGNPCGEDRSFGLTATSRTSAACVVSLRRLMMADEMAPPMQHRRPHPQSLAAAYLEFDLAREIDQLHQEPEWTSGHNAKTLVKYDDLRVVLIALRAHARVPTHQTEGRISVQTIRGHVHVRASGRTFDLPVGNLLTLDRGLPHDVEAVEESAVLLTIAWPRQ